MDKGNNTEIEAATLALTPGATRNHDNVALGGKRGARCGYAIGAPAVFVIDRAFLSQH